MEARRAPHNVHGLDRQCVAAAPALLDSELRRRSTVGAAATGISAAAGLLVPAAELEAEIAIAVALLGARTGSSTPGSSRLLGGSQLHPRAREKMRVRLRSSAVVSDRAPPAC